MKNSLSLLIPACILITYSCVCDRSHYEMSVNELAENFEFPPSEFGPYVWWHWLGPNISREGIDKDLRAMKESGIAGATIFNVTSNVHEPHHGIFNTPWPENTYRSESWWEAVEYAAAVADELGLKIGMHNAPGYATTGGPWIDESRGIQELVYSETVIAGGGMIKTILPEPELPTDRGWGSTGRKAVIYSDVAVMAVPQRSDAGPDSVMDITDFMDNAGNLLWDAPEGRWNVLRIGQAAGMTPPHPVPEDQIGMTLEVDKMNRDASEYHWDNVLEPIKEHLGQYIGKSFTHILIDSYEADNQSWTSNFREEFIKDCGYDPLPFLAYGFSGRDDGCCESFHQDMRKVINRLYFENGWNVALEKINQAGLDFYWEPYWGPFDVSMGAALADVPMDEAWTDNFDSLNSDIIESARLNHKRIVGVEAFSGKSYISGYTEDPAFLKNTADGILVSGGNRLFLHHWTHQPFDDRYKPGLSMGTWGTHFGRNQTWFEPGKAFFRYLTRCQMILQQGELKEVGNQMIHRSTVDAEFYFITNRTDESQHRTVVCDGGQYVTQLWNPYTGKIYDASSLTAFQDGNTSVSVELKPSESMFVVFTGSRSRVADAVSVFISRNSSSENVDGGWDVVFKPAASDEEFVMEDFALSDFSLSDDERISFFSGTAVYTKKVDLSYLFDGQKSGDGRQRVLLDLGGMNDIAVLSMNGKEVGVLWNPPYFIDITDCVIPGENLIEIAVSVDWANRLIGDERYEDDMEWIDCDSSIGALNSFPDWVIKGQQRPSSGRKTFANYKYYDAGSELEKAGLTGPVKVVLECE